MDTQHCQKCNQTFSFFKEDLDFYQLLNVPPPQLCPTCRKQRRLSFRNSLFYYPRKCDLCKKSVISLYSGEIERTVYCIECYNSDQWDPLKYGRDFDFSRTFTEQFDELLKVVPRVALLNTRSVNSAYTQFAADNSDCYMSIQSSNNENCGYGFWLQKCNDCLDCSYAFDSEICYECLNVEQCFKCVFCQNSFSCSESWFLLDCSNLSQCFGCVNLKNKQFCVFNEQKTEQGYFDFINSLKLSTRSGLQTAREMCESFFKTQPRKFAQSYLSEDSEGNYLYRVKNCFQVFHGSEAEHCRYAEDVVRNVKDCMDVDSAARDAELIYECLSSVISVRNNLFSSMVRVGCSDMMYCDHSTGSRECFGSVSLKKNEFCIFNKTYLSSEYGDLKNKIINHMKTTGEWGVFFDPRLSSFGYNETDAQQFFPLSKVQAQSAGFHWTNKPSGTFGQETTPQDQVPETGVGKITDFTKLVLACSQCQKNYKLTLQELRFYKQMALPIPLLCFSCRHQDRLERLGPSRLFQRLCSCSGCSIHGLQNRCATIFSSPYSNESGGSVYCQECYDNQFN